MEDQIRIEIARCRSAWKAFFKENNLPENAITFEDVSPIYAWCLHHEERVEPLSEPIWNRIDYILLNKPERELDSRFLNLRPVSKGNAARVEEAWGIFKAARGEAEEVRKAVADRALKVWNAVMSDEYQDYLHTVAEAWKVLQNAMAEMKDTLNSSLGDLHLLDVPNHTWNGKSIF